MVSLNQEISSKPTAKATLECFKDKNLKCGPDLNLIENVLQDLQIVHERYPSNLTEHEHFYKEHKDLDV